MKVIMSRRKQSNPKPLLKRDDEDFPEEGSTALGDGEASSIDMGQSTSPASRSESPQSAPSEGRSSPSAVLSPSATSSLEHPATNNDRQTPSAAAAAAISDVAGSGLSSALDIKPVIVNDHHKSDLLLADEKQLKLPTLRLNTKLASDPALQPEAKVIKETIHMTSDDNDDTDKIIESDLEIDEDCIIQKTKEKIKIPVTRTSPSTAIEGPPRIQIFTCGPCGIRFSSLSTLEAHQTYYCSHRKEQEETSTSAAKASSAVDSTNPEPTAKAIRTGKQYACSQCSYSADKKVSLNRHMRMHQTSPTPSSTTSNGDDPPSQLPQVDRYCSDCDIRFSSTKTYRAHKQHYCSSRHRDGQPNNTTPKPALVKGGSQSPPEVTKSPPTAPAQPQAYLALPTNPIVIVPCAVIRGASILPGPLSSLAPGVTNPEAACFIFQNGSFTPIAHALNSQPTSQSTTQGTVSSRGQTPVITNSISTSSVTAAAEKEQTLNVTDVLRVANKKDHHPRDPTIPLDLSVRRLSPRVGHHVSRERSQSFSSATSADHNRLDMMDVIMEGKENLSIGGGSDSLTPEQIVCAPSLPGSPPLTPSPKRRSNSPRGGNISISPNSMSSLAAVAHHQQAMIRHLLPSDLSLRLSEPALNQLPASHQVLVKQGVELALRLSSTSSNNDASPQHQTPPLTVSNLTNTATGPSPIHGSINASVPPMPSLPPQIYVKQGVSKCKECNIVFCKYENYLAHKKHYCSARNLDDADGAKVSPPASPQSTSPSGGTGVSGGGGGNAVSNSGVSVVGIGAGGALAYQQLICAACGIKFTSLDNLSAHQMYYCPKRVEIAVQSLVQKERCLKCKTTHDPNLQCPASIQGSYKCPICDVVSSNAAESRRHMETHGGVKAFRCSICRYKGNTLRGMRTHIRMHFEKKTSDFNEENYITCILEEDGVEIPPAAQNNPTESLQPQLHSCDMCNYSSSYKGNVVRHIKLVHTQTNHSSSSPKIGEGGESLIHNGSGATEIPIKITIPAISSRPPSSLSVSVKIEPEDLKSNEGDLIIDEPEVIIKTEIKERADTPILIHGPTVQPPPPSGPQLRQTSPDTIMMMNTPGSKYCKTCDIKFTFPNTYIAHKKYYCKSGATERENNSSPAAQSAVVTARATEASVL